MAAVAPAYGADPSGGFDRISQTSPIVDSVPGNVSSQPANVDAVNACKLLQDTNSEPSYLGAESLAKGSVDAGNAAATDTRWSQFAKAYHAIASLPEAGNTPAQISEAQSLQLLLDTDCQSMGVNATVSITPLASGTSFPNVQTVYDYFVGKGLTNYEAAAIVGNFDQESGDSPTSCQQPCGSGGAGIAQWSFGGRWNSDASNNAVWYASTLYGSPSPWTLAPQLEFTWYELTHFSGYGLSALENSGNVTNATIAFQNDFEGCSVCDQNTRIAYATDVLNTYGNSPPPSAIAFQANTGSLYSYSSTSGSSDLQLGMMAGTSPSIAGLASGGYEIAFQSNTGVLWFAGTQEVNTGLGMMAGTSPSITALANGGWEAAFQSNTGVLWTAGAITSNTEEGMDASTSPSITALGSGYEIAFQSNNHYLYIIGQNNYGNTDQGMMAGTSPSIAGFSNGEYETAFQANTAVLIAFGNIGNINTGQGMLKGTSPTIASLPGLVFEVAFQANTGYLYSYSSTNGPSDLQQGMMAGTSPSITALA